MDAWRTTIEDMEEQTPGDPEELLELINFQYGYIGWCLGQDRRREVQVVLSRLEENLERLKSASGETADYHAYAAAAYGFRIGLSAWRAPALGPRSMKHAEKALQVDGASFQANLEMGNLWRYRPAVFGGSKAKALPFYVKALAILEQEPSERRCRNWMYLKLLVLVGQLQQDLGNPEQARRCFEQALQIEPGFVWAKEALASLARR